MTINQEKKRYKRVLERLTCQFHILEQHRDYLIRNMNKNQRARFFSSLQNFERLLLRVMGQTERRQSHFVRVSINGQKILLNRSALARPDKAKRHQSDAARLAQKMKNTRRSLVCFKQQATRYLGAYNETQRKALYNIMHRNCKKLTRFLQRIGLSEFSHPAGAKPKGQMKKVARKRISKKVTVNKIEPVQAERLPTERAVPEEAAAKPVIRKTKTAGKRLAVIKSREMVKVTSEPVKKGTSRTHQSQEKSKKRGTNRRQFMNAAPIRQKPIKSTSRGSLLRERTAITEPDAKNSPQGLLEKEKVNREPEKRNYLASPFKNGIAKKKPETKDSRKNFTGHVRPKKGPVTADSPGDNLFKEETIRKKTLKRDVKEIVPKQEPIKKKPPANMDVEKKQTIEEYDDQFIGQFIDSLEDESLETSESPGIPGILDSL